MDEARTAAEELAKHLMFLRKSATVNLSSDECFHVRMDILDAVNALERCELLTEDVREEEAQREMWAKLTGLK